MDFWYGSEELALHGFLIRAFIVYIYMFIILKVLGQRSIGTLHPLDFLFGVIIGDVLGEPLSSGDLPLAGPVGAAALISTLHLVLSYVALKTPRFRRVIEDEPIILVEKGRILENQLRKTKITVESLLMDLRLNQVDLIELDYAVLESNGQISFIKKSKYQTPSFNDLQLEATPQGYPSVLIQDGAIVHYNLKKYGGTNWLKEQIQQRGLQKVEDVFLMTIDEGGQIYLSEKQRQSH
nr:DUF421 domain-containing protein [Caldalkalibacillus salinus]